MDVTKTVDQFRNAMLKAKKPGTGPLTPDGEQLKVTTGASYERFSATVDMAKALEKFNRER